MHVQISFHLGSCEQLISIIRRDLIVSNNLEQLANYVEL